MTTYTGFSTYNRVKKFKLTDFDLISQDLFNHFNIRKGEKLMDPAFGSIIWSLLFEPFTPDIKELIITDINEIVAYDPRVTVRGVNVSEFEHGIQVELILSYVETNQTKTLLVKFDKNTGAVRNQAQ